MRAPARERPDERQRPAGVAGLVFDVEEFAVHDGPGIRTTVFLKGCPLRCVWCHNPEGLAFRQESFTGRDGRARVSGTWYRPDELADRLLRHRDVLEASGGGVTFSGGEPLSQVAFVLAVADAVRPLHVAVETSGQAPAAVFRRVADRVDLVIVDVKLVDDASHRRYTGLGNARILENVRGLCSGSTPFVVRIPLIPGVTDSIENLEGVADLVAGAPALRRVELLPYNAMAGAKYAAVGRRYDPPFDVGRPVAVDPRPLRRRGIPCEVQ